MIKQHLNYIENKVRNLLKSSQNNLTIPTIFEYYTAYLFTKKYETEYNVYKYISPTEKINFILLRL